MDIAVVDDEKAIREHICAMIAEQKLGSNVEAYTAGEELFASGKRFDIVFLDIRIDGMNGIEAVRQLRGRQEEFPITDKADKKSHGIGLANIKNTAEKY